MVKESSIWGNISQNPMILGLITCFGNCSQIRGNSSLTALRREDTAGAETAGFLGRKTWLGDPMSPHTSPLFLLVCRVRIRYSISRIFLRIKPDNPLKPTTHAYLSLSIIEFTDKNIFQIVVHCSVVPTFTLCSEDKLSCVQLYVVKRKS